MVDRCRRRYVLDMSSRPYRDDAALLERLNSLERENLGLRVEVGIYLKHADVKAGWALAAENQRLRDLLRDASSADGAFAARVLAEERDRLVAEIGLHRDVREGADVIVRLGGRYDLPCFLSDVLYLLKRLFGIRPSNSDVRRDA
jgi:hypothetical protein